MKKIKILYNPELLNASKKDKLRYFKQDVIVEHKRLKKISEEVVDKILYDNEEEILVIVGPTGVGKSTLLDLINKIIKKHIKTEGCDINIVTMVTPSAIVTGRYDWKDFCITLLEALKDPFTKSKKGNSGINPRDKQKITVLKRVIKGLIKLRGITVIFLDEAQHLAEAVSSGAALKSQINFLKTMVIDTEILYVLIGTYGLNSFEGLDGQIDRRMEVMHFSRYDDKNEDDCKSFKQTLYTLLGYMPIKGIDTATLSWEYFYDGSLGCIGALKRWLFRGLIKTLATDEQILTKEILDQAVLPERKRRTMLQEIKDGENFILHGESEPEQSEEQNNRSTNTTKKNGKIARKPTRDNIGIKKQVALTR